jgi:hypothetical protein
MLPFPAIERAVSGRATIMQIRQTREENYEKTENPPPLGLMDDDFSQYRT